MFQIEDCKYNTYSFQDKSSIFWVSSSNSWNKCIGKECININELNSGLNGDYIQSNLLEDENGQLYFTLSNYLCVLEPDSNSIRKYKVYDDKSELLDDYYVWNIDTEENKLYFTSDDKLFSINYHDGFSSDFLIPTKSRFFSINKESDLIVGVRWMEGPGIEFFTMVNGFWSSQTVTDSFLIDGTYRQPIIGKSIIFGEVVYFLSDLGLLEYSSQGLLIERHKTNIGLNDFVLDKDRFIISTAGKGLLEFDLSTKEFIESERTRRINRNLNDTTPYEIYIHDRKLLISYNDHKPQSINLDNIGVTKYCNSELNIHSTFYYEGSIFAVDKKGKVYKSNSNRNFIEIFDINNETRDALLFRNEIWIASNSEVYKFDLNDYSGKLVRKQHDGVIYGLNTVNDFLFFSTGEEQSFLVENKDTIGDISSLVEDGVVFHQNIDGIWHSNFNGVVGFTNDTLSVELGDLGYTFSISSINDIVLYSTNQGLYRLENTSIIKLFDGKLGLEGSIVYGVSIDKFGNWWIATSKGLYFFNHISDNLTKIYLPGNIDLSIDRPLIVGDSLFVSTNNGVWFTDNLKAYLKQDTVKLDLQSIFIDDKKIESCDEIRLNYLDNRVDINFNRIDFSGDSYYKIRCRESNLLDFEYLTETNFELERLSPGSYTYTFEGIGANLSISKPINLTITVLPPYHQTWWFRTLCILGLIGIGFFISYIRTRQKLKQQQIKLDRQEALQSQRNRMSQDLHDEMGSGLSAIKHLIVTQSTKDKDQQIESIATNLIRSMRDLLWSLDESNDTVHSLSVKIRQTANQLLRNSSIQHKVKVTLHNEEVTITGPTRRNLILVTKEIINNALKHSQATAFDIIITSDDKAFYMDITDNGIGYDTSTLSTGYGLKSINKRLVDIGASAKVSSDATGTHIHISLPIT